MVLTLSKRQIFESSKRKEFADDRFKFDENGSKFSKPAKNTVGKGEVALYEQFLLFPPCFQKICNTVLNWFCKMFYCLVKS